MKKKGVEIEYSTKKRVQSVPVYLRNAYENGIQRIYLLKIITL